MTRSCPNCDSTKVKVHDSRVGLTDDGDIIVRSRHCSACGTRWRTEERFVRLINLEGESLRSQQMRDGTIRSNFTGWNV